MTGFKGEKVQNPSDDHTIEEARVARIAKSQQRTCPRRTRASRGTVAARQTTFVRDARFCRASLDIHGSRQASESHRNMATER